MEPSEEGGAEGSRPPSSSGSSKGLNLVAIALAAAAIVLAVVLPGPVGPAGPKGDTGATGAQGPQGVTVIATGSNSVPHYIPYVCAPYANVTITVPGPGTVAVSASVRLSVLHTMGTEDVITVALDLQPGRCANDSYLMWYSPGSATPSSTINASVFVQKAFTVYAATTYRYYVSGYIWPGEGGSDFLGASLVAVFYPS